MARKQRSIVPIFIPHQGCPYRCVFCDQNEISGVEHSEDAARVRQAFETYLFATPPNRLPLKREVAFYGGTFTGLPAARQEFLLSQVQQQVDAGWVHSIRLSTHSDFIDAEKLDRLACYSVKTVELGVQSTDADVLSRSGRIDAFYNVPRAASMIRERGFELGMQLMVGLPGDDESRFLRTVSDTIALQPDFVRIYPTLVLRGTALFELYQKGDYTPWSLERTVSVLARGVRMFQDVGIPVIRIGLHPEPSMLENLVAGPHHPALRSLVDSRLALEELTALLDKGRPLPEKVVVRVPSERISHYTGHQKENVTYLKNRYALGHFVIQGQRGLTAIGLAI